ncbi:hypothetical protein EMCRGX_G024714 [Ephydatia muelleri]
MEEDELFTFKNTKQLTFGSGVVVDQRKDSSRRDSNSSSDDDSQRRKRRGDRRKKTQKNVALDPRPESPIHILDDSDIPEPVKSSTAESLSDSDSPPPLLPVLKLATSSKLSRADEALNRLKSRKPPEACFDGSEVQGGKIHKYPVRSADIWARICHNMAMELGCSPEQILLSHRTVTMDAFHRLGDAGITVGDIVDAVIVEKTVKQPLDNNFELSKEENATVTVTFRTVNKNVTYRLAKCEPLLKGMKAFAASLGVALSRLHFTFDGEPLDVEQTAADLDLQDDDVIDVRVVT